MATILFPFPPRLHFHSRSHNIKVKMKVVAVYLLAVLGGNASPSTDDLKVWNQSKEKRSRGIKFYNNGSSLVQSRAL
ncbi:hypothetical protein V6Z11_A02G151200 [Gossypium hirsutum]